MRCAFAMREPDPTMAKDQANKQDASASDGVYVPTGNRRPHRTRR